MMNLLQKGWQWAKKIGLVGAGILLLLSGAYAIDTGDLVLGIVMMVLGLGGTVAGYRVRTEAKLPQLNTESLPEAQADEAELYWQKALADNQRIEVARKKLRDYELQQQLARMQQDSVRLLSYLEKHPDRILAARRFIDYYQDKTAELAEQYQELEATQLNTQKVRDVKNNLKDTLYGFQSAYEAEFQKVLDHQLMDMDAEMTVMQQDMDAAGIKAKPHNERPAYQPRQLPTTFKQRLANFVDRPGSSKITSFLDGGHHSHHSHHGNHHNYPQYRGSYVPATMPESMRGAVVQDKIIQSALAIFLGCIGAHKFYQGKPKWGIIYLLLCWTSIPTILGILEGLRYLLMSTESFYEQYYHKNNERDR